MKTFLLVGWGVLLLLAIALACAPEAAQPGAPTPKSVSSAPVSSVPTITPSTQEAAWALVVEAAKKEGKVTAYSFIWVGDVGLEISRAFKQRYGITLDIITGRGAEFVERVKAEKRARQHVGDMWEGSTLQLQTMKQEGLLVSVANDLPSLREKGVWLVEPTAIDQQDKMNLVWRFIAFTPYINTKLVKLEEKPTSWKDLLAPKWKGKMSFTEPNLTASAYEYMVVLMENKAWDEDYIKALYKQNLRFPTGLPDEFLMLSQGEVALSIRGSDGTAGRFANEGAPIQAIDMKEGVALSTSSVAAIAGGPNPNATRVLLDWIYSKEGISIAGKAQGNKMVRSDVQDFRAIAVQTHMTKPLVITTEHLAKATRFYQEKWFDKLVGR